jgi:hypothetical protein
MQTLTYQRHLTSYASIIIKPILKDSFNVIFESSSAIRYQKYSQGSYLIITPKEVLKDSTYYSEDSDTGFCVEAYGNAYKLTQDSSGCTYTYSDEELPLLAEKVISLSKCPKYQDDLRLSKLYFYASKNNLSSLKKISSTLSDPDHTLTALTLAIENNAVSTVKFLSLEMQKHSPERLSDLIWRMFHSDLTLDCFNVLQKSNNYFYPDDILLNRAISFCNHDIIAQLIELKTSTSLVTAREVYNYCRDLTNNSQQKAQSISTLMSLGLSKSRNTVNELITLMPECVSEKKALPLLKYIIQNYLNTPKRKTLAKETMSEVCISLCRLSTILKAHELKNHETRIHQMKADRYHQYAVLYLLLYKQGITPACSEGFDALISVNKTSPLAFIQLNEKKLTSTEKNIVLGLL